MTQQPAQGPGRMPNPVAKVQAEQAHLASTVKRVGALVLGELRVHTHLLTRLVELGEQNKAALDKLQEGDASEFSVRGLGRGTDDTDSPFIGG